MSSARGRKSPVRGRGKEESSARGRKMSSARGRKMSSARGRKSLVQGEGRV